MPTPTAEPCAYSIEFILQAQEKFNTIRLNEDMARGFPSDEIKLDIRPGKVYDKIVMSEGLSGGESVHAFVRRADGALIKAATWAKPQRGVKGDAVRFMLDTPEGMEVALNAADRFGSYLYDR